MKNISDKDLEILTATISDMFKKYGLTAIILSIVNHIARNKPDNLLTVFEQNLRRLLNRYHRGLAADKEYK